MFAVPLLTALTDRIDARNILLPLVSCLAWNHVNEAVFYMLSAKRYQISPAYSNKQEQRREGARHQSSLCPAERPQRHQMLWHYRGDRHVRRQVAQLADAHRDNEMAAR